MTAAQNIQAQRFSRTKIYCNAKMSSRRIRTRCQINESSRRLLESAIDKLGLSSRAFICVLKIARTTADLAGNPDIGDDHISEAIQYRNLDRGAVSLNERSHGKLRGLNEGSN